ncbi:MAG: response regulator transcription factor [Jatrophihabitantaceae bacterium]
MALYRIAIVDDSDDLRALLTYLFDRSPAFEVCGEGASGTSAVEIAEREHPDVMLLDLTMPGMSGMQALEVIRQQSEQTKVFVLSGHQPHTFAAAAAALGAAGVLEKDGSLVDLPQHLLAMLPSLAHGRSGSPESE